MLISNFYNVLEGDKRKVLKIFYVGNNISLIYMVELL